MHEFGALGMQFTEEQLPSQLKLSILLCYSKCNPYLNGFKMVQAQPKTSKQIIPVVMGNICA